AQNDSPIYDRVKPFYRLYFFIPLIHARSNSTPSASTRLLDNGGICPGPRRPTRCTSTERPASPGTSSFASGSPNVWCNGVVLTTRILSSAVVSSSSICALPPPASTWHVLQFACSQERARRVRSFEKSYGLTRARNRSAG